MIYTNEMNQKLLADFIEVKNFNATMKEAFLNRIVKETVPPEIETLAKSNPKRVGYIVATCCPTTKAHIELAKQSIERLKLDRLVFIIWPFHYIHGFHNQPLNPWVAQNGYLTWEERMEMLRYMINLEKDERIVTLDSAKNWYIESENMFDPNEVKSAFWTGTWYVIRKFQYLLQERCSEKIDFFFCCGEDQFNPNIYALDDKGTEKVWKDYSIIQHLAIHNVFAVPRKSENSLERMPTPDWSFHDLIFGEQLQHYRVSATQVRTAKCLSTLRLFCNEAVVKHILAKGYWGFKAWTKEHNFCPSSPSDR
jgi:nicotinic acid mononucleotide adenylyltransferase